jgi:hypothetical protein
VIQRRDSAGGRNRGIACKVANFEAKQGAGYVGNYDLSVTNRENVMTA